jgi:hypothetical protein
MPRGQDLDEIVLQVIRVLVFIHEHELELPLIMLRERCVVLQKAQRLFEQVIEIERVRLPLLLASYFTRASANLGPYSRKCGYFSSSTSSSFRPVLS